MALNLQCIGKFENCHKWVSENPIKDIWDEFQKIGEISHLTKHWKDQKSENYIYVSTSITQAFEYYKASKVTSLKTRPLLLYYSLLNLAKAILFLKNDKRPADYHGLCKPSFSKDILQVSAKVNKGVFSDLSNLFDFNLKEGQTFNLADFCETALEVYWDFSNYFEIQPKIITPNVDAYFNGDLFLIFNKKNMLITDKIKTSTNLLDDFYVVEDDNILKLKNKVSLERNKTYEEGSILIEKHFEFSVFYNQAYYINLNEKEKKIPQIMAYFGILYILSNLVRYKPESIHEILEEKETSIRWFFNRLCDTCERVYPNLLLNILYDSRIKFASSFF